VGRARHSGTNSAPVRDGPRVLPAPVWYDGCTALSPVAGHVGSCCKTVRGHRATGPAVDIRRTANTATM